MSTEPVQQDPFSLRSGDDGVAFVVAVYGEVDLLTAGDLAREIERGVASPCPEVIVDLSTVRFIDSTGLHVLIAASARAQEAGKTLRLLRPSPAVNKAFEITGLDHELPFED
ncbi:MAG TPA: STAS domain-containing protein [Capillimicrobium sp.]|nr:STAS domain-containing protein [Capillimicrobium sp.]